MSSSSYDEMGKIELRSACKAAGISYSKLTVAGMREALQSKQMPATKVEARVFADADNNGAGARLLKAPVVTTSEPVTLNGVVKAEREMQNAVRAPIKGVCRDVWNALDELHAAGTAPTAQHVRDLAKANGWNYNNASIELYQWRRFMGLSKPRLTPKRKKSAAKDAPPATQSDGSVDQYLA